MKHSYQIYLILLIITILIKAPAAGSYTSNKDNINQDSIRDGLETLKGLDKDEGLLYDYILYLSALRHHYSASNLNALQEIDRFLLLYPDSYLLKDMRLLRIEILYGLSTGEPPTEEIVSSSEQDIYMHQEEQKKELLRSLEAYTKEYPDDERGLYLYAMVLKRAGMKSESSRILKRLYINGGSFYSEAKREVSTDDLTISEIFHLNKNILKAMMYEESEGLLLETLKRKDPAYREKVYEALGDTYFRMKEYPRAAVYYLKGKNYYQAAISYYRTGSYDSFEEVISSISREKTSDTCRLLILKGLKKRRDGNFEGALSIFRGVYSDNYPCKEEALWNIGWAEYLMGNFLSASYNFRDLFSTYGDPKYLYWQARAGERLGKDANRLYSKINDDSFYAVLSHMRRDGFRIMPVRTELRSHLISINDEISKQEAHDTVSTGRLGLTLKRAELLSSAGLNDYAVRELMHFVPESEHERFKICSRLQLLGAYDESLRCAYSLKGYGDAAALLYPHAYRKTVERIASESGIDPLLILSVMREESRFREDAFSAAGAIGLMQLMPFTAKRMAVSIEYGIEIRTREDIVPADVNITLGSHYLKQLMDEFRAAPYAVAAYNAGESAVRRWLNAYEYRDIDEFIEDIPYRETRGYVKRVLKTYFRYRSLNSN